MDTRPHPAGTCDIDHFKQINDVYGHVAGDTVLQEVASRFMQSVRTYDAVGLYGDAVGRYGGEEFLLILSDCDAAQIRQRAENVRESIEKRPFQVNDSELSITVSIGFTTVTKWDKTQSIEGLLDRVDTALYAHLLSGGNQPVFALQYPMAGQQPGLQFGGTAWLCEVVVGDHGRKSLIQSAQNGQTCHICVSHLASSCVQIVIIAVISRRKECRRWKLLIVARYAITMALLMAAFQCLPDDSQQQDRS